MSKRRRVNEKQLDPKLLKKRGSAQLIHDANGALSTSSNSPPRNSQAKSRVRTLVPTLRSVWLFSCAVRVVWTLYGQNGYIHPDEFFQGPEVVAGDVLDLKVDFGFIVISSGDVHQAFIRLVVGSRGHLSYNHAVYYPLSPDR